MTSAGVHRKLNHSKLHSGRVVSSGLVLMAVAALTVGFLPLTPASASRARPVPLIITSFSSSPATPLTPLTIHVKGLKGKAKISVTFSGGSGFRVKDLPFRVTSNTVVVGAPVYLDPTTGSPVGTSLSVYVTQSGRKSRSRSLSLATPPTDASLGLPVGELSHAFLVYQALLLSQKLNELQAEQALLGVDTSQQVAQVSYLLQATLEARNDVDRIIADPTTIIASGQLLSGTPVQFDVNTVATMDSFFASFLEQTMPSTFPNSASHSFGPQPRSSFSPTTIKLLTTAVDVTTTGADMTHASSNWDKISSITQAAAGLVETWGPAVLEESAGTLGAILSVNNMVQAYGDASTNAAQLFRDTQNGADAATIAADQAQLQKSTSEFHKGLYELGCLVVGVANPLAGPACEIVVAALDEWGALPFVDPSESQSLALMGADNMSQGYVGGSDPAIAASAAAIPTNSANEGYALVDGSISISNSSGAASAQDSTQLCTFGASFLCVQAIADPSGNYEMFVPIGAASTNYSNLTFSATDFITGNVLSSSVVNLSAASLNQPVTLPNLVGTCNDADSLNPDGDDPDCD
jgi:hypothetical protein